MSSGEQDIEQAIFLILGTAKGERVMRPDFGSNLSDFVFAPNNVSTASLLAYEVEEALGRWEPRIEVTNVEVQPDPNRPACLLIDIQYQVKATNDEVNMVFPFYLNPTEE